MYWTSVTAAVLGDAPWEYGVTKAELIEYAEHHGASRALLEELREIDDDEQIFYDPSDLCVDTPTEDDDFGWNDDEY